MFEFWDVCVRLLDQHCFCMQINIYRNTNLLFDYSVLFINNYSHKIETRHPDCTMNVTFYIRVRKFVIFMHITFVIKP
jgi:hypothetical protein